jgi:hypothetical protein
MRLPSAAAAPPSTASPTKRGSPHRAAAAAAAAGGARAGALGAGAARGGMANTGNFYAALMNLRVSSDDGSDSPTSAARASARKESRGRWAPAGRGGVGREAAALGCCCIETPRLSPQPRLGQL